MNINIIKVKSEEFTFHTGGGCAENTVKIEVDAGLPLKLQVLALVHEISEVYFPCLSHPKIVEFENLVGEGLDELDWPE